jgi:formylglycine-generating enzyme
VIHRKLALSVTLAIFANGSAVAIAKDPAVSAPVEVNSIGMKFAKIPAGEFMMGNHESAEQLAGAFPQYDAWRFEKLGDELPLHRVKITQPFYMGIHTVTVGQFKRFVQETNYRSDAERDGPATVPEAGSGRPIRAGPGGYGYNADTDTFDTDRNPKHIWRDPGFPQTDDHPVVDVSFNDATAFAQWLSRKEAKTYRLPTEAEWEYACRAGTTTRYWAGDDPEGLPKIANLYDATTAKRFPEWNKYALQASDGFVFTAPVGSFQPNAFGLYDMHGNAWQWVSDWYGADYYAKSPVEDPQGPATGIRHVRRGGAWLSWPLYVRASFRNFNTPESRYFNLSFRLVLEDRKN